MSKFARIMAWTLVVALAFVTLAPIGLRPFLAQSADLERALAYILLGFLLTLAYPRHRLLAFGAALAVAAGLEAGQLLIADRHGRWGDFLVKALSAGLGATLAHGLLVLRAGGKGNRICPGG